jgi:hypothetical protein
MSSGGTAEADESWWLVDWLALDRAVTR